MFSRALMWDNSSCKAKSEGHGCGSAVPCPLAWAQRGQGRCSSSPPQHRHLILSRASLLLGPPPHLTSLHLSRARSHSTWTHPSGTP